MLESLFKLSLFANICFCCNSRLVTRFPTDLATASYSHCVKSVQIRIFFWSVFSCIQSEYGKIRTRKTAYLDTFAQFHFLKQDFTSSRQKVFCKKSVTKFTGKYNYRSLFFHKVADLRPATLITGWLQMTSFRHDGENLPLPIQIQLFKNIIFLGYFIYFIFTPVPF